MGWEKLGMGDSRCLNGRKTKKALYDVTVGRKFIGLGLVHQFDGLVVRKSNLEGPITARKRREKDSRLTLLRAEQTPLRSARRVVGSLGPVLLIGRLYFPPGVSSTQFKSCLLVCEFVTRRVTTMSVDCKRSCRRLGSAQFTYGQINETRSSFLRQAASKRGMRMRATRISCHW